MTKKSANPWLIAIVVSLATFMEVLDTTITNVSLRHIAGSLGAGQDESTWVLTSYLVANGIILPLSGWLSDVMGRKKFFVSCILGFTFASFMCGAATSLMGLVVFRILQGAAGGGLQPTQQAIIIDSFPPSKRGTVFAITGITMIAAPIIGPTLGGFITDNFSWRWVFYINVPVGIIAAFLVWNILEDPPHAMAKGFRQIDFTGISLITIGLASMQIVLDKGQQDDWFGSAFIVTWTVISITCLISAIVWLWQRPEPVIDLSLFKDRAFAASCGLIFMTGFVLYGGSALLPLLLQSQFGYDATLAGLILSPGGVAVIIFMPVVARLIAHVEARYIVVTGLLLCASGMFHTMYFTPQTDFSTFMWMRINQVLGLPLLFIPISTLAFSNIPKEKSNKASALYSLFRNVGGSIGIALAATYLFRMQQVHQNNLAGHLVAGSPNYEGLLDKVQQTTGSHGSALGYIYQTLLKQAAILAYSDTFLMMGVLMASAALFALFILPANKPHAKSGVGAH